MAHAPRKRVNAHDPTTTTFNVGGVGHVGQARPTRSTSTSGWASSRSLMPWQYEHGRLHSSCSLVPCSLRLGVAGSSRGYLLGGRGCEESTTRGGQAMMRLRRTSVIVMLTLLASAATAYAECAWVTWAHTLPGFTSTEDIPEKWEPLGAIETRADCEAARARLERFHRSPDSAKPNW